MKASELRTGNLIILLEEHITVDANDIYFIDNTETEGDEKPIAKGILLTEEWLIKIGFKKGKYSNCFGGFNFTLKASCCWISYTSSDFSMCIANSKSNLDTSDFISPTHSKIIHVHQLQNLYFALTGEELNIKS